MRLSTLLIGSAVLVVVAGCDAVIGIPGDVSHQAAPLASDAGALDGSSAAVAVCDTSDETDACFLCTDESCCQEYTDCANDPRCGEYYKTCIPDCEAKGNDYASCVVSCDSTVHGGHATFAPYFACSQLHCLGPCSRGKTDTCTQCAYASCADATAACAADADCDTVENCITSQCIDSADHDTCVAACEKNKSPTSKTLIDAMFACWVTYCSSTCEIP